MSIFCFVLECMHSPENIYLKRKYTVNFENLLYVSSITFGWLNQFNVRQHDNGYKDDRSQFNIHTDGWTQVHITQSSLVVTHSSTN